MNLPKHGGGWHSIGYTLKAAQKVGPFKLSKAMVAKNTCKTCALGMGGQRGGMRNEAGEFPEFCKKSIQAQMSDLGPAIRDEYFAEHSVEDLQKLSPRELDQLGRLTKPLILRRGESSYYRPISWDEALNTVASQLKKKDPEQSFFYFSGRSSNEAGFLLQLFCRAYGTNHVNNCSYYCHQASGVGLKKTLGTGTATVVYDDLEQCDLFVLIGGNPSSNHPRLLTSIRRLRERGGKVIVVNPARERGLERFSIPSNPKSLLFGSKMFDLYLQPHIGGDMALMYGIAQILIRDQAIDREFIETHTTGYSEFTAKVSSYSLDQLCNMAGITTTELEEAAAIYKSSQKTIFAWTMGITHHVHGVDNVETIAALALMRGMVGKPGCGLLPIRGHSNVQGMGSMGVVPELAEPVLAQLKAQGLKVPEHKGFDTMSCMEAAHRGDMRFALCLGGNLYGSNPDLDFAKNAFTQIETVVYLSTTLNTGHAHGLGETTLILPVLARDEERQSTTQESMFNYVRLSDGGIVRHKGVRAETDLIAEIASKTLGESGNIRWADMADHEHIRSYISDILPDFKNLKHISQSKQEFQIPRRTFHEPVFHTDDHKAKFVTHDLPDITFDAKQFFKLMSIRSEGQFNTVVYEEEDVYRGQTERDIVLISPEDMKKNGWSEDDLVTVTSELGSLTHLKARPYPIRPGAVMMYFPEVNAIIPRTLDPRSRTPAYKAVLVRIVKTREV